MRHCVWFGLVLALFGGLSAFAAEAAEAAEEAEEAVWKVPAVKRAIKLDGSVDRTWSGIPKHTKEFTCPWEKEPVPATTLRMCHDEKKLYFLYEVEDKQVISVGEMTDEIAAAKGDRVEIFLATPDESANYYCFEMDAVGRVLDYEAKIYRKFNYPWKSDWLKSKAVRTAKGYRVEGEIDLDAMRKLNILQKDGSFLAGFFRAEYYTDAAGKTVPRWITWKHPGTEKADFHVWGAFGKIELD